MQQPVTQPIPAGWPGVATYAYQAPLQAPPQAAPVAPAPFPTSPNGAQPPMLAQQLVHVARSLEQLFPGYQALVSLLLEATATRPSPRLQEAVRSAEEALYYHGATLGAIRRILCGEASANVLMNLATAFHHLSRAQPRVRAAADQVLALVPSAQHGLMGSLVQSAAAADGVLAQAGTAIQALVGQQAWESARTA
ncbi:MAG: hypothetical protein AB2385_11880 [Symbiobacterium sp.]|uniref:hypothetical protein n=1 Tax=Symbiobacterium sp. TaxID=1971213 RepID=UPI0034645430